MKNILSIIVFTFVALTSITAQTVELEKTKKEGFQFTHKTQLVQLFTSNVKYAFEVSVTENTSIELEGNYRSKHRGLVSSNDIDESSYYGQVRVKNYFDLTGNRTLQGYYYAPVVTVGASQAVKSDGWGGSFRGGALNQYVLGALDFGYQGSFGPAVMDMYIGAGFSANSISKDLGYNNSHTHLRGVALRMGMRVGIGH